MHELIPSLHSNILFQATPQLADRIHEINVPYMQAEKAMQLVTDVIGAVGYLTKERTSEADRSSVVRTIKQEHARNQQTLAGRRPVTPQELRPFIGDRIKLSNVLKKDLISRNIIDPFRATNWQPQSLVGYTGAGWVDFSEAKKPEAESRPIVVGQIDMFPDTLKPAARLHQHVDGILLPSAAKELEFKRRRRGLSQRQLGIMAGLSQSTIANAVNGRFGLSRAATERVQQVLAS